MEKKMSRLLALLCALMMVVRMAVPAFAEEVEPMAGGTDAAQVVERFEIPKDFFDFQSFSSEDIEQYATDEDQAILNYLIEKMKKRETKISLPEKWNIPYTNEGRERLQNLWYRVRLEAPEVFYIEAVFFEADGNRYTGIEAQYAEDAAEKSAQLEQAVTDVLRQCVRNDMTDEEKALALHDYLTTHIAYDMETLSGEADNYDAYTALVKHTTVCQGYSEAYKLLMNRCNIPCEYVRSGGLRHIWNVIYLDKQWYQVDVTWDDPIPDKIGYAGHTYFLRDDSNMGHKNEDGTIDWMSPNNWTELPNCTDSARYDSAFWKDTTAPVVLDGKTAYYIGANGLYKHEGDADTRVHEIGRWVTSSGGQWMGTFSGLSRDGNLLYWNDGETVYQWEIDSTEDPKEVYTLTDNSSLIWGSTYQNGEMRILIASKDEWPNDEKDMSIKVVPLSTTPTPSGQLGDVTGDGKVNVGDLVKIKRYILGLDTEIDMAAADVTKDGKINVGDLVKIKRYSLGLDTTLA